MIGAMRAFGIGLVVAAAGLDVDLRESMRTTLGDLRSALGFAMVFVTHDGDEAAAVADRTFRLTSASPD